MIHCIAALQQKTKYFRFVCNEIKKNVPYIVLKSIFGFLYND